MPGSLTIEATEASSLGFPVGVPHLCLIYQDLGDGREYVIRSGPPSAWQLFNGEMKIETNVPIEQSADARDGETPAERHSTALDFGPLTDDQAWSIMVKYALTFAAADVEYDVTEANSNTFVAALLHACGVAPDSMLPRGIEASEAIGFSAWRGMVADVAPPADGIFRGTGRLDRMTGRQFDEEFRLLGGDDVLGAGRGDDLAFGGSGNDRLWGGAGNDTTWGGPGRDLLVGGAGNDQLLGGSGPDTFHFHDGGGADRIEGFLPGTDLIRIQSASVSDFDDLAFSRGGGLLRIAFADSTIALRIGADVDLAPRDVQFLPADDLVA
jgi:RTX calcium-binding nonapeptide repeat (4 copies)